MFLLQTRFLLGLYYYTRTDGNPGVKGGIKFLQWLENLRVNIM